MRNTLAEDVLDINMLHLMTTYKATCGDDEKEEMSGTITLLE